MKAYKTSETARLRAKAKRDAIKASGGEAYAALLAKERDARAAYRKRYPEKTRAERKRHEKTRPGWAKRRLLGAAKRRGRKRGMEATICMRDLVWPTHCPVLGIELDYATRSGSRKSHHPNNPSLDRFDCTKGYVPGNVIVISFRANTLKSNATIAELEAITQYLRTGCTLFAARA